MKKYKSIFFDLDHTLWDFETNSREALTELHHSFQQSGAADLRIPDLAAELTITSVLATYFLIRSPPIIRAGHVIVVRPVAQSIVLD